MSSGVVVQLSLLLFRGPGRTSPSASATTLTSTPPSTLNEEGGRARGRKRERARMRERGGREGGREEAREPKSGSERDLAEATQVQIDGVLSQLLYKFCQNRVASVGD